MMTYASGTAQCVSSAIFEGSDGRSETADYTFTPNPGKWTRLVAGTEKIYVGGIAAAGHVIIQSGLVAWVRGFEKRKEEAQYQIAVCFETEGNSLNPIDLEAAPQKQRQGK